MEFYENISESIVEEVESGFGETTLSGIDALINDAWYNVHPDKILGVPYESSGRHGKVTKYKGDINDVKKIDAEDNFIGNTKILNDPLASASFDINASAEVLKPENEGLILDNIEQAAGEVEKIRKRKSKKAVSQSEYIPSGEIKTFYETFKEINPNITLDEVEVYVWYKSKIGKPLSKYYVSLFAPELFSADEDLTETYKYEVSEDKINSWINDGLLFFTDNKLLPAVEYLQGNMYERKIKLDADAEYIKTTYGEDVYEKQAATLKTAFTTVYERRLTIGAGGRDLILLPISKFAQEFMISGIESTAENKEGKFKIKRNEKKDNYGKPDILGDRGYRDYKRYFFNEISLVDAFKWWLINKNPELKEPISFEDIINYYVDGKNLPKIPNKSLATNEIIQIAKAKNEKLKSSTQREGERLFKLFLETEVLAKDRVRIETQWNITNNNFLEPDYDRIPIGFRMMRDEKIRQEKRDAVAFTLNNGTGILSYDVGVGKTPSAIFTISAFIDAGYCKRPLVVVPNQVYRQFITEIKKFTPHLKIKEAYNLSEGYLENFMQDGKIVKPDVGTITIMTYEGFKNIGFSDETKESLQTELFEILSQGSQNAKDDAALNNRIESLVGQGLKKTTQIIEDFGFDFVCYDEAHKMKKVFTGVKGEAEESDEGEVTRGKNPYKISSGTPSDDGLRGFMINFYILKSNNYKNVLLLTATPFTNSPLEIYSMLSMVAYERLKEQGLNSLKTFFDTYINATTALVINSKLKPVFKQVVLGFNNLISLQILIRRFILYKTGEEVGVQRPKKYVLPYLKEVENGVTITLGEDKKIESFIQMTPQQKAMMDDVIAYVENGTNFPIRANEVEDEKETEKKDTDEEGSSLKGGDEEIDEDALDESEKLGVRTIKGLSYSRNLALSPYLFKYSGLKNPTYKTYVETSPKLMYVMSCIKSVREYHIAKNEPISGQVIYMDRGKDYFPLLKEYLINEIGYAKHEVGIIVSGLPKEGNRSKEYVKNLFNGEIYNEETKEFEKVSDDLRIKVVIGSSTIKEGMNLQKYGTVLYNCFIDWNPTDIQQLEGRIYRQGNNYNAVRIVNPLVIDSADIFLFQKLQEKTSRLNSIWSRDGKTNVLSTDELNPEELKFALIRDPLVIAELKTIEEKSKLESEKLGFERQLEQSRGAAQAAMTINSKYDELLDRIKNYRDFEPSGDKLADALRLIPLVTDLEKKQTDKEGKKIVSEWDRKYMKEKELEEVSNLGLTRFNKPYWFTDFAVSARDLNKYKKNYLDPQKVTIDFNDTNAAFENFRLNILSNIESINKAMEKLNSKEYKEQLVESIIEEKQRLQVQYKPLPQVIADFNKLNYLLSDVKVPLKAIPAQVSTLPTEKPMEAVEVKQVQPEPQPMVSDKERIKNTINALNLAKKYSDKEQKKNIDKQISSLKIALQYI